MKRHTRLAKHLGGTIQSERGFSIVELLIAMMLLMVVMGAVYGIWFGLQRTYTFTDEDMTAQEQARSALGEMIESIRTARQPGEGTAEELDMVIVRADPTSLICWTDLDRDQYHTLELVRFRVETGTRTLYRDMSLVTNPATVAEAFASGNTSPVRLVANWVSNGSTVPLFTYVDANGDIIPTTTTQPVSDPTLIREVAIDLRIDVYTDKRPIAHQLSSVVQPRNLRQY